MAYNIDEIFMLCYRRFNDSSLNTTENQIIYKFMVDVKWFGVIFWPLEISMCAVSSVVSAVNMIVLTRPVMLCLSFSVLLIALELSSLTSAIAQMYYYIQLMRLGVYDNDFAVHVSRYLAGGLADITVYCTNWLTVSIGVWRFLAVVLPLKANHLLTKLRAYVLAVCIVLFCLVPLTSKYMLYEVVQKNLTLCQSVAGFNAPVTTYFNTEMTQWASNNSEFIFVTEITILVLYVIIPCVCLLIVTLGLVWNMYRKRHERQNLLEGQQNTGEGQVRTTIVLIILLWLFLSSSAFMFTIDIYHYYLEPSDVHFKIYVYIIYVADLFANTLSFPGYYFMGTKFRDTFHELVRKVTCRTQLEVIRMLTMRSFMSVKQ